MYHYQENNMDMLYEVMFALNDLLNIIVKCVALMAMHCYIIKGVTNGEKYNKSMD